MKILSLFLLMIYSLHSFAKSLDCEEAKLKKWSDLKIHDLDEKICGPKDEDFDSDPTYYSDIKVLSPQQRLIFDYTHSCFKKVNPELRKTQFQSTEILNLAEQIDVALCNYPSFEGTAYRGVDLPEDILKQYLESHQIIFTAFTSASKMQHVGCDFAGNTVLKIFSKNGKIISSISKHRDENEILFRLNSTFKVVRTFKGEAAHLASGCNNKNINAFIELEETN